MKLSNTFKITEQQNNLSGILEILEYPSLSQHFQVSIRSRVFYVMVG